MLRIVVVVAVTVGAAAAVQTHHGYSGNETGRLGAENQKKEGTW